MEVNPFLLVNGAISVILVLDFQYFESALHGFDVLIGFLELGGCFSRIDRVNRWLLNWVLSWYFWPCLAHIILLMHDFRNILKVVIENYSLNCHLIPFI